LGVKFSEINNLDSSIIDKIILINLTFLASRSALNAKWSFSQARDFNKMAKIVIK